MAKRRNAESTGVETSYLPVLRLWMLRALLGCNGVANFLEEHRFADLPVARMLGFTDADMGKYSQRWALQALKRKLSGLGRQPPSPPPEAAISRNLQRLAERFGLNQVEQDILHLSVLHKLVSELSEALDMVGELSRATTFRLLAECLGHPISSVQAALEPQGKLSRSALLVLDIRSSYRFSLKVEMLEGMAEELMLEHDDLLDLFRRNVTKARAPQLELEDFPHLCDDVRILRGYLDMALRLEKPGVNILIHGRPGTGKTEFVRALGQAVGAQLREIPVEEPDGAPRAGRHRFEAFRCAQTLLAGTERPVLLFDEVEDVFCEGRTSRRDTGNSSGIKGWVNQLLENNAVPTFWVTNHLGAIDPAYRRRFDYVLHMDMPPASVRRRVIDRHVGSLPISAAWKDRAAEHPDLAPAVVERAVRMSALVCDALPEMEPSMVLTRAMNNTLHALGVSPLESLGEKLAMDYRLDLVNADCDLGRLKEGLRRVGEGRLCLYGPPGTGKTEFGRHIAKALDRPLLVKRASDILSPYVGMAEKNIASMFAEAHTEGAVLLLDEADSLLRDRQSAQRSWEVTQVNEMLTQMEGFQGIFIASTNLKDSLDAASLRRFDSLIKLDYLKPAQAWEMLIQLAATMNLTAPEEMRAKLDALTVLTPGDFAAVSRLSRLDHPEHVGILVARLKQMCEAKHEPVRRLIGFLQ